MTWECLGELVLMFCGSGVDMFVGYGAVIQVVLLYLKLYLII
jgi:hypothetical protein